MNRALARLLPRVVLPCVLLSTTGCITVYQPMTGLHEPKVIDIQIGNFNDLDLVVHCVPQDILEGEAGLLCRNVKQLFENQGARVRTVTSVGRSGGDDEYDEEGTGPRTELIVELRARHQHENTNGLMWTFSILSLTLAPGISENTFVQEVAIRDAQGTLLYSGELKGRIVRYFGIGYWLPNKLFDLFRDDDQELTDSNVEKHLSGDLYNQLSQMVFNAKMRQRVLGEPPLLLVPTSTTSEARSGRGQAT